MYDNTRTHTHTCVDNITYIHIYVHDIGFLSTPGHFNWNKMIDMFLLEVQVLRHPNSGRLWVRLGEYKASAGDAELLESSQ